MRAIPRWPALGLLWVLLAPDTARPDPAAEAAASRPLDGRAVMERVDARPRGGDQTSRARWRLIDKRGSERVRETLLYWLDTRGTSDDLRSKRLIRFTAPTVVRDTAFLVWSRLAPGEDDFRWIYLPALRKTRRLAGRDRRSSFMGTDFLYEDLSDRAVEADDHRLLRAETRDGALHYVVESVPRESGSPYARREVSVHGERWTPTRVEFWRVNGRHAKTLDVVWTDVDGVWVWERLDMQNHRNGHRTIVELSEFALGQGLSEARFAANALGRAP